MSGYIQNTIIPTNLPGFPWPPGNKVELFAIPLNNAFIALQNQITSLANTVSLLQFNNGAGGSAGTSTTLNWGGNAVIAAGPYVVTPSAPYQFSISSILTNVGSNGGSFIVTILINGVPVPGLTNILVDSPVLSISVPSGPTTVTVGSEIDVQISNVIGAPENSYVTIQSPPAEIVPQFGFSAGHANGQAIVHAVANQTITTTGTALGQCNVISVSAALPVGSAVGAATGSSQSIAIASSVSTLPTLALDDPSEAGLDFNPLG